jgi:hypothetical protein
MVYKETGKKAQTRSCSKCGSKMKTDYSKKLQANAWTCSCGTVEEIAPSTLTKMYNSDLQTWRDNNDKPGEG